MKVKTLNMIIPPSLKKGDKIGIVSTARKINLAELAASVEVFKKWGLVLEFGKYLFQEDHQFSGTDAQRAEDLQRMISDDSIKAIICARGGYGTVRIIDSIDFTPLIKNPKWVVGFSDITVLHSHLHNLKFASLHASMPISFKNNTQTALDSLYKALFLELNEVYCDSNQLNSTGLIEGEVIGGNLSILCSLLGSESDINTEGKILFLEDLDEYLYHIDRMVMSLKRAGKFSKIKGLIVGSMTDMNDNTVPFGKTAEQIIFNHVNKYNYPKCFNFPSGHINDNRAIIFGKKSILKISSKSVVLCQ